MKKIFSFSMMAIMALMTFTSCEDDDGYLATTLRNRDWQGYIDTYYQSRWRLSGNSYATCMRFESKDEFYTSGRGYEVDYDTRSPYKDYAYCTFKWFIVDGEITLIYDDAKWNAIYIVDYRLSSSNFYGYIYDGSNRKIKFDLSSTGDFVGWDNYGTSGGYGDFINQNWYYSRQASADEEFSILEKPAFIDRTEQVRQETGISDAVSIASGKFAEAMSEKD